jgi:hypothetical protein
MVKARHPMKVGRRVIPGPAGRKELKVLSLETGESLQTMVVTALNDLMVKNGKKPAIAGPSEDKELTDRPTWRLRCPYALWGVCRSYVVSADDVQNPNQPNGSAYIADYQRKIAFKHPINMRLWRASSSQCPCHNQTGVRRLLGSTGSLAIRSLVHTPF